MDVLLTYQGNLVPFWHAASPQVVNGSRSARRMCWEPFSRNKAQMQVPNSLVRSAPSAHLLSH